MTMTAIQAINAGRRDLLLIGGAGRLHHASATAAYVPESTSDEATLFFVVDDLLAALGEHMASRCDESSGYDGAHIEASTLPPTPQGLSLSTKLGFARECLLAHMRDADVHASADRRGFSDDTPHTATALFAEAVALFNQHVASAMSAQPAAAD